MAIPHCTPTLIAGALALAALLVTDGRAEDNGAAAVRELLETRVEDGNRKDLDALLDGAQHDLGVPFGAERFDGIEELLSRHRKS